MHACVIRSHTCACTYPYSTMYIVHRTSYIVPVRCTCRMCVSCKMRQHSKNPGVGEREREPRRGEGRKTRGGRERWRLSAAGTQYYVPVALPAPVALLVRVHNRATDTLCTWYYVRKSTQYIHTYRYVYDVQVHTCTLYIVHR